MHPQYKWCFSLSQVALQTISSLVATSQQSRAHLKGTSIFVVGIFSGPTGSHCDTGAMSTSGRPRLPRAPDWLPPARAQSSPPLSKPVRGDQRQEDDSLFDPSPDLVCPISHEVIQFCLPKTR